MLLDEARLLRYSPLAELRLLRGSLLAGARLPRYSPLAGVRLLAEARELFRASLLADARLVPRELSSAAVRVASRVPSPARAAGPRRPWSLVVPQLKPSAADVRVPRPAGFLAGWRGLSAAALRPAWRAAPPAPLRRRSWPAPPGAARPRP